MAKTRKARSEGIPIEVVLFGGMLLVILVAAFTR